MNFLNATLLFAVASIAIPVVLHLISRREPRKVVFPSIRFLTTTFESSRSKLRVRRWWLLALRMAALAALAIALARPVIHQSLSITWLTIGLFVVVGIIMLIMATISLSRGQSKGLTYSLAVAALIALLSAIGWGGYTYASGKQPPIDNAAPTAVAILIDNSPTSVWKTPKDNRIARCKETAKAVISRLPPTSRIAIVDRSATPVSFALDVASAVSKVDQLRPLSVVQPIASRIDAALRLIRTSDLENRKLLVITDLTASTWGNALAAPSLPTLVAETPEVGVTVFDLGEFDGTNRSLSMPVISDLTPPLGVHTKLRASLSVDHLSDGDDISVTAELEMYDLDPRLPVVRDGVVQRAKRIGADRTSVQLSPGSANDILLTIPPLEIGVHHGVVRLIGDDALPTDNIRHFSVEVLPPSRVLLVGDNLPEANEIRHAITVTPGAIDSSSAEYIVERIGYQDLPAVRTNGFAAVILLDPPASVLNDENLVEYVNQGGNVFASLGANAAKNFNGEIKYGHLPTLVRPWRSPDPHTFFTPLQTTHPILAPLSDIDTGVPWSDFRVQQYWQVDETSEDSVLIRFAGTKHAALVQRTGTASDGESAGSWTLMTTPIPDLTDQSQSWNDLFSTGSWPALLLVRQTIEVLTGRGSNEWMSMVGQPKIIPLPPPIPESATRRLQLFPPGLDATPVPMDIANTATEAVIGEVTRPGTYWLRGTKSPLGFSVNVLATATNTQRIEAANLDNWFGPESYELAAEQEEIELANTGASQRVSLRSPLMLLALAVFLLELILGNRFYRSQRNSLASTSKPAVAA